VTWEHLRVGDGDIITEITLDRPDRRNALSLDLMRELRAALEQATGRIVVIAGAGPAFSAGHDLNELVASSDDEAAELFDTCASLMTTVQSIPQPVIAKVHGVATAAGCQLVASCDLAVAGASAGFAAPGGKGGLFCHTPMVAVARNVGRKRAMELALTGDVIDAATALEWGLVNRVVADDDLDGACLELLRRATRGSAYSKGLGKQALYHQLDLSQPDAYRYAIEVMAAASQTADGREGVASFLEKRRPQWSNR
jgi:enoyl-CoA hydratase/carnithine racemase